MCIACILLCVTVKIKKTWGLHSWLSLWLFHPAFHHYSWQTWYYHLLIKLSFDFPYFVHVALMMKGDNQQNCPVNESSVTSIAISQWENKMDWNQKTTVHPFFLTKPQVWKRPKALSHPCHCSKVSQSFIPKEAASWQCFYGITLFICIISTWPRLLLSFLFATSVTASSVCVSILSFLSCILRNTALHSGLKFIHKVL